MTIGASVLLIAVGAILAFAVDYQLSGLDINIVGWILMLVGVVGLILTFAIWAPRSRRATGPVVEERRVRDEPRRPAGDVVEERRVYDDRPPAT